MKKANNKTDILSDGDIERIGNLLDSRIAPLSTQKELLATKKELKGEYSRTRV